MIAGRRRKPVAGRVALPFGRAHFFREAIFGHPSLSTRDKAGLRAVQSKLC
jgi:hypothetical protein